jgi:hypothetical protein
MGGPYEEIAVNMPVTQISWMHWFSIAFELVGAEVDDEIIAPGATFLVYAFFSSQQVTNGFPRLDTRET